MTNIEAMSVAVDKILRTTNDAERNVIMATIPEDQHEMIFAYVAGYVVGFSRSHEQLEKAESLLSHPMFAAGLLCGKLGASKETP
jgi:DNA-binding PucR family transcriptional regulator